MTAQLAPVPIAKFFDNNGAPLAFGLLTTYAAGTTTPQATYVDSTQTTQNNNPIQLNFRGECNLWLDPTKTYKFLLQDSQGNTIPGWPVDNIPGSAFVSASGSITISANLIPSPTNTLTLGDASTHSWANIYLGPSNAPAFDPVSGNIGYYKQTLAEANASVTPTDFAYVPGDVRRYGATGNGVSNDLTALQAAINQSAQTTGGAPAYMPSGTYNVGSGTLNLVANCSLIGAGRNVATITGSTTGILIDGFPNSAQNVYLAHFSVISTGSAAFCFRFGNGVQHIRMEDVAANGVGGTGGAGINFNAGSPGRFSGNFHATLCYFSGFYYGIQFIDGAASNKWTTVSFKQCYLLGPAAAAGSIGIWQDANSNLVGSSFLGGTIENFAKPVQLDNGATGAMTIDCDIESNTNPSTFPAFSSFNYRTPFSSTNEPAFWWQDANSSSQVWARERNSQGVKVEEQYSNRYLVILADSTNALDCAIRAGNSLINGSSPSFVGGVHVQPAGLTNPNNNWMYAPNGVNKMCWGSAAPTGGTWSVGDICWNTGVPAAGTLLWACTTGGTPGTWTAVTIP